jgi:hypothetical protein
MSIIQDKEHYGNSERKGGQAPEDRVSLDGGIGGER